MEADRESRRNSPARVALAQAYNHMILPLANLRDKYTQIIWGIRDFQYRFGRDPEGMWLPEPLWTSKPWNILAENEFSSRFSHRVRPLGSSDGIG